MSKFAQFVGGIGMVICFLVGAYYIARGYLRGADRRATDKKRSGKR